MDFIYKHVGENVRSARRKAHVTQAKLAEALNLSTSHFSGMERGYKKFTIAHIVAIARYLDIPVSTLLVGLTNEGSDIEMRDNKMLNFPAKQAAQDFCNLVHNCSQEEIEAILEVCSIFVGQMSKLDF
ncbi:helix-turn-helix domain-containing protein [Butyricicoccus sp.]|uniref:helix-turn-helix domain-containing protein n=1 Tax=Butyricicoccus sp. TaxID=2049021 RepID=UPI003AAA664D